MPLPKDCPIGPQRKRKRTPKKHLEATVVRECLQFLAKHPDVIYVERRNTGAVQFQDGGFVRFGAVGAADIWCLVRRYTHRKNCRIGSSSGRPMCCPEDWGPDCEGCIQTTHIEIECKRSDGKGRQSAAQKKFQEFCASQHIPYILCSSTKQLAEQLGAVCS